MIEKNPIGNDLRATLRERRLGEGTVCVKCLESNPVTIEMHHPTGRAHCEEATVPECRNCHAESSEAQRVAGADLTPAPSLVERVVNALRSLGDFFVRLGKQFLEWAEGLDLLVRLLNFIRPDWRDLLPN